LLQDTALSCKTLPLSMSASLPTTARKSQLGWCDPLHHNNVKQLFPTTLMIKHHHVIHNLSDNNYG
jgi:hypothetical protein